MANKQIKDFNSRNDLTGLEEVLIQDIDGTYFKTQVSNFIEGSNFLDLEIASTAVQNGTAGSVLYIDDQGKLNEIETFKYDAANKTLSYVDDAINPQVGMLIGKKEISPDIYIYYSGFVGGDNTQDAASVGVLDWSALGGGTNVLVGYEFGNRILIDPYLVLIESDSVVDIRATESVAISAHNGTKLLQLSEQGLQLMDTVSQETHFRFHIEDVNGPSQFGIFNKGSFPVGQQGISVDPSILSPSNDYETLIKEIGLALMNYGWLNTV